LIVYTQPHGSKDSIYIDSWLSQVLNISQQLIFKHMAMFKKIPMVALAAGRASLWRLASAPCAARRPSP
jgi:hypothetical protein